MILRFSKSQTYICFSLSLSAFSSLGSEWCDKAGPMWQQLEEVLTDRVREAAQGRWCQSTEERQKRCGKTANALNLIWSDGKWQEMKRRSQIQPECGGSLRSAGPEERWESPQEYWVGSTLSWPSAYTEIAHYRGSAAFFVTFKKCLINIAIICISWISKVWKSVDLRVRTAGLCDKHKLSYTNLVTLWEDET